MYCLQASLLSRDKILRNENIWKFKLELYITNFELTFVINKDVSDALIIKPRQLWLKCCRRVDSNIWRESDRIHTFTLALCFSSFLIASHCHFLLASPFCGGSRVVGVGGYRGARSNPLNLKQEWDIITHWLSLGLISEDPNFRNFPGKDAAGTPPTVDRL